MSALSAISRYVRLIIIRHLLSLHHKWLLMALRMISLYCGHYILIVWEHWALRYLMVRLAFLFHCLISKEVQNNTTTAFRETALALFSMPWENYFHLASGISFIRPVSYDYGGMSIHAHRSFLIIIFHHQFLIYHAIASSDIALTANNIHCNKYIYLTARNVRPISSEKATSIVKKSSWYMIYSVGHLPHRLSGDLIINSRIISRHTAISMPPDIRKASLSCWMAT